MQHRTLTWTGGILTLGAALVFGYSFFHPAPTSASYNTEYWQERIERVGANAAYQELDRSLAHADPDDKHRRGHSFGAALYNTLGVPGVKVCDDRYLYACYHEFMARAIQINGLSLIPELALACGDSPQCKHGIGHGVLSYFGYTEAQLEKALATCEEMHDATFDGCAGGALMEYNLRSAIGGPVRYIAPTAPNMHEPCDTLSQNRDLCYYWQADILKNSWEKELDATTIATKLGRLCQTLSERERRYCMAGVGAAGTSVTKYDVAGLQKYCADAGGTPLDQALCHAGAAKAVAGTMSQAQGLLVCNDLPTTAREACHNYVERPQDPSTFVL